MQLLMPYHVTPVTSTDGYSSTLPVEDTEYTICFVLQNAPIDLLMVADATSNDAILQAIIHSVSNSWKVLNTRDLKPFYSFCDELSTKACSTDVDKSTIICERILF